MIPDRPAAFVAPSFADAYDQLILNAVTRRYYEASGFYNTGYWTEETASQCEASVQLVDRLLAHAPARTLEQALDVACGLGATTRLVSERWTQTAITGINVSERQLLVARRRAPGCTFHLMDAAALGFADESFDVILCVEAAFHFRSRETFLREAYRVLRPGGRLLISDILLREGQWLGAWSVPEENLSLRDADAYARALCEAGFSVDWIEDATEQCWRSHCQSLGRWLSQELNVGRIELSKQKGWLRTVEVIERSPVECYVLAAAERPKINQSSLLEACDAKPS